MMAVITNKGQRPKKLNVEHRSGGAVSKARGPDFNQLSAGLRTLGIVVLTQQSYRPFYGVNAAAWKAKWGKLYSYSAQECIQDALQEPEILADLGTKSKSTSPELVVLGEAFQRRMKLHVDIFYQSATFRDPVFNPSGAIFDVDILKKPYGDQWYQPVDGDYTHLSNSVEIYRDGERNGHLTQYGDHLVVIHDDVCFSRESLRAFLDSRGAP